MRVDTRLAFLSMVFWLCPAVRATGDADDQGWQETWKGFAAAFKDYDRGKSGSVTVEGPAAIVRGEYGQWSFTYRAGSKGIRAGGGIKIAFRHLDGWGVPQTLDPGGPNYATAHASTGQALQLQALQRFVIWNESFLQFFPWQHTTGVTVDEPLKPGATLTLTLGDRTQGSPGLRAPSVVRDRAVFQAFVDTEGDGTFIPIPESPYVKILPGSMTRLSVVCPSQTTAGEATRILLRAEDDQGNVAADYHGEIALACNDPRASLAAAYRFTESDRGLHWIEGARFQKPGVVRVRALDRASQVSAESNPMRCGDRRNAEQVYWGELHGHSFFSDGTGTPQQYYAYSRDVAALDVAALTDHSEMIDETRWNIIQDVTRRFYQPGRFVTLYAYEWGGTTPDGGNHNVYYLNPGLPVFRSSNSQNDENPWLYYGGVDVAAAHVARLFQHLRLLPGAATGEIMVIPHWRGGIATPQWQDPVLEPLVEIAQEAGCHEQWAQSFITPKIHIGYVGGSDDHYGRPGYGMDDRFENPWDKTRIGSPLAAIVAPEKTREQVFQALRARHSYATTGARILLAVTADGHPMGDEYRAAHPPLFKVSVSGTAAIRSVELRRVVARRFNVTDPVPDQRERAETLYKYPVKAGEKDVEFEYRLDSLLRTSHYYIRVVQSDGEQAFSSPILISE